MKTRQIVIGAALVIIGLPVALVLIAGASLYVLDRTNGTMVSSGQKRHYLLYVPESYDRAKPTPLVISMHAAAGWPAQQMHLSRWNRLADEQGFIVVYPSGSDVPKIWHVDRGAGLMRDGELGSKRPVRSEPRRFRGGCGCHPSRIHALCWPRGGGVLRAFFREHRRLRN